jgi:hypothetical protein
MKRIIQAVTIGSLLFLASLAAAQYEAEPYMEGFVGGNFSLPSGFIKNDITPGTLKATNGVGLELGGGYFFKPQIVAGLSFNSRNMGTDGGDLNHRVFEFDLYGKYLFFDLAAKSFSPYAKLSAGLAFSKLATKVSDNGQPVLRELSYKPALGTEVGFGIHYRTNSYGAIYAEAAYHVDFMDGVKGKFQSVEYPWNDNNKYIVLKAGILFNVGRRE